MNSELSNRVFGSLHLLSEWGPWAKNLDVLSYSPKRSLPQISRAGESSVPSAVA